MKDPGNLNEHTQRLLYNASTYNSCATGCKPTATNQSFMLMPDSLTISPTDTPSAAPSVATAPSKLTTETLAGTRATVNLGAIQRNYLKIARQCSSSEATVAIKANGYGLGAVPVAKALWSAGCRAFFVAHAEEGIEVRKALPKATINVLNGVIPGTEQTMVEYNLTPTVISLQQLKLWQQQAYKNGTALGAGLHLDSGMHRTGLPASELARLLREPERFHGLHTRHIISHLASADEVDSKQPEHQLDTFRAAVKHLPQTRVSIANSAGIFRDKRFHLDFVRSGIAVYGGNPQPGLPNPMETTVVVETPILQVVDANKGDLIGYGSSYRTAQPGRHAIIAAGYADGVLRSSSNSGAVSVGGYRCAVIGRVSMDVTIVDVSAVPDRLLYPGAPVQLLGNTVTLDEAAQAAGTIGYEMLTSIGNRCKRHYTPG